MNKKLLFVYSVYLLSGLSLKCAVESSYKKIEIKDLTDEKMAIAVAIPDPKACSLFVLSEILSSKANENTPNSDNKNEKCIDLFKLANAYKPASQEIQHEIDETFEKIKKTNDSVKTSNLIKKLEAKFKRRSELHKEVINNLDKYYQD